MSTVQNNTGVQKTSSQPKAKAADPTANLSKPDKERLNNINELSRRANGVQAQIKELSSETKAAQDELAGLEQKKGRNANRGVKTRISQLKAKISGNNEKLGRLQEHRDTLTGRMGDLASTLGEDAKSLLKMNGTSKQVLQDTGIDTQDALLAGAVTAKRIGDRVEQGKWASQNAAAAAADKARNTSGGNVAAAEAKLKARTKSAVRMSEKIAPRLSAGRAGAASLAAGMDIKKAIETGNAEDIKAAGASTAYAAGTVAGALGDMDKLNAGNRMTLAGKGLRSPLLLAASGATISDAKHKIQVAMDTRAKEDVVEAAKATGTAGIVTAHTAMVGGEALAAGAKHATIRGAGAQVLKDVPQEAVSRRAGRKAAMEAGEAALGGIGKSAAQREAAAVAAAEKALAKQGTKLSATAQKELAAEIGTKVAGSVQGWGDLKNEQFRPAHEKQAMGRAGRRAARKKAIEKIASKGTQEAAEAGAKGLGKAAGRAALKTAGRAAAIVPGMNIAVTTAFAAHDTAKMVETESDPNASTAKKWAARVAAGASTVAAGSAYVATAGAATSATGVGAVVGVPAWVGGTVTSAVASGVGLAAGLLRDWL